MTATTRTITGAIALSAALAALSTAATAQIMSNVYSAAELAKARAATTAAGYAPVTVIMSQAGAIFMKATKEGKTYVLTITADGKIYPSTGT